MPVSSDIQLQLKRHEQWLIGLRQNTSMTTAKIIVELEDKKGLKATSSQLETYFRHLGQRKNLSRHEWIAIFRALDSQRALGHRFDLYISGKLITEQDLQKKRKNAKPPQPLVDCLADADRLLNQLPHGVSVRANPTPGSPLSRRQRSTTPHPISNGSPDVDQDPGTGGMLDCIVPNSDPEPRQDVILRSTDTGISTLESLLAGTSSTNQSVLLSSPCNTEVLPFFQPIPHSGDFDMGSWNASSPSSQGIWESFIGPLSPVALLRSLPSPSGQSDLWVAGRNYASPTTIALDHRIHDLGPIESARLLVENNDLMALRRGSYDSKELPITADQVLESLQSLVLFNSADGDFGGQIDIVGGAGVSTNRFVQLLIFSMANNFAGLEGVPAKVIFKFIVQHEPVRARILHHLKDQPSTSYSRVLEETLLEAAVETGDAKTVEDLLTLGNVKPNDAVCWTYSGTAKKCKPRMTLIEKASKLRHLDIVELLLRLDVDLQKTYTGVDRSWGHGALECAVGIWGEYIPVDIKLVDLLLDHGATVSGRLMGVAIRWGDTTLLEKLMSKVSPSEHRDYIYDILCDATEYLRNDLGHKFVRWAIQACRDIHNNECINRMRHPVAQAMYKAARRNNRSIVDLLVPHGGQDGLNLALIAAVQFGSHGLVGWLLANGASAGGGAYQIDGENAPTPLEEAIRRKDSDIVDLLAKEGAWDRIEEPRRLQATLIAIAESGNSAYLRQVLQLVSNPSKEALTPALLRALRACHEEIALGLLEAGADPKKRWDGDPLLEALRIKSQSVTWAILECDMSVKDMMDEEVLEAAIEWGDLDIIKALFLLGHGVNNYWGRPPLSFAIKAGKRSLIELMIELGADLSIHHARDAARHRGFYTFIGGQYTFVGDGSEEFSSPLAAAVLVRDEGMTNYLLDHGADPADEQAILNAIIYDRRLLDMILQAFRQRYPRGRAGFGGSILLHALKTSDEPVLELCLGAGFDVNNMICDLEYGKVSALGFAIEKYHTRLRTISKLLDAGGDPNLPASVEGGRFPSWSTPITARKTALLSAIETKNLALVQLLIDKGAKVEKEANLGLKCTPLQQACEVGSHSIVDLLLSHNANVNAAPAARHGATALQLAAKSGSTRIAKKLVELGAEINAPGVRIGGRSAIEYAAKYGRLNMISFLFEASGGKFLPDQRRSAIALARENGHLTCASLLTKL